MPLKIAFLVFIYFIVLFGRQIEGPMWPPKHAKLEGDPCGNGKVNEMAASTSSQPFEEPPVYTPEQLKDHANYVFLEGNFEEAARCFDKAISIDSTVAKYYRNRGLCYTRLNKADLAIENFQTALVLDPTSVRGLVHMSRQLLIIGRLDEAFEYIEKALDYGENHNTPRMTSDEKYQVVTLQEKIHAKKKEKEEARLKVVYSCMKSRILEDSRKKIEKKLKELKSIPVEKKITESELIPDDQEKQETPVNEDMEISTKENENVSVDEDEKTLIDETQEPSSNEKQRLKIENEIAELEKMRDEYLRDLLVAFPGADDDPNLSRDIPDYLCDKISFEIMKEPMVTTSGITYEKAHIMKHLEDKKTDPTSGVELRSDQLRPNKALKEAIDDFIVQRGINPYDEEMAAI